MDSGAAVATRHAGINLDVPHCAIIPSVIPQPMLGGCPYHHSMARPRVADGRDGRQLEVSYEYIE
jgi:hypothetical protein